MVQVAERFLSAVEDSNPGMNLFIAVDSRDMLAQAAAATERYKQGAPFPVHSEGYLALNAIANTISFQGLLPMIHIMDFFRIPFQEKVTWLISGFRHV